MEFVMEIMYNHPELASVFIVIGVLRAVFKPIQLVVDKYVEATPDKDDDGKWEKIKDSKAYKFIAWLLDYSASIKIPR